MNMDKIRFDLLQLPDKQPGIDDIEIAVQAEYVRQSFRDDPIKPGADIDLIFIFILESCSAPAAAGIDLEAFFSGLFGNVKNDIAGTRIIVAVNFYDCFHRHNYNI